MTLLEVAKQALEAMEDAMYRADTHEFYDAKESLRYAIEQAEQEPDGISWLKRDSGYFTAPTPRKPLSEQQRIDLVRACGFPKFNDWHDAAIGVTHSVERAHGIGEQQ